MTTYTGQWMLRGEDAPLLTGNGSFIEDMAPPGLLHATALRSVHAHARITRIDTTAALAVPGVVSVITSDDLEGSVGDLTTVGRPGMEWVEGANHPVLARGKVGYVGQLVAMVVAESLAIARDAVDLVRVDYEPLPVVMDIKEAAKDGSAIVHEHIGTNLGASLRVTGGDLDTAFARADHVIDEHFEVPRLSPAPLEGRGAIAQYDPEQRAMTLWMTTQGGHHIKELLEETFNLPIEHFRVMAPDVGGGFGMKHHLYPEDASLCYLAYKLGRPVKWVEERMENMMASHARGFATHVQAAIDSEGHILGFRARQLADMGAYYIAGTLTPINVAARRMLGPYLIDAADVECVGVFTNLPPTGPFRGAGQPESTFCVERTMDIIAAKVGLDPVEVRRRNLVPPSALPYTTATGMRYDSGDFIAPMDRAVELADYDRWRDAQRMQRAENKGKLIGIGVATACKAAGGGGASFTSDARVVVTPQGKVKVYTEVSPHGQGIETVFSQIAADVLGITPADVQVLHGDSDMVSRGQGTFASRSLTVGGSATHVGATEARNILAGVAAQKLGCAPEEVEFKDSKIYKNGSPGQAMSFAEVAAAASVTAKPGDEPGFEVTGTFVLEDNVFSSMAHIAVVEVDPDTGRIRFLRYVAVHDCGPMVNPMIVEGQVHGGIAQGLGEALGEVMAYTPEGQPLTGSLMDYHLPLAEDMPEIIFETVNTVSPMNPLGVRGIGEAPTVAAPVAVANAVADALSSLGVTVPNIPLTPLRVWNAIHHAGS
jgi:carbon-monoxide dehydrogenase large subunit